MFVRPLLASLLLGFALPALPAAETRTVVFVGDSIYDVMAAKNAGVPSVAVSFGFLHQPVDELGADALVCLGYPFYAVGKPEKPRVEHLAELKTPTLIVQGERDALGNREAVAGYALSPAIEVSWLAAADHDLKPLKVSGFSHEQHMQAAAERVAVKARVVWACWTASMTAWAIRPGS